MIEHVGRDGDIAPVRERHVSLWMTGDPPVDRERSDLATRDQREIGDAIAKLALSQN